MRFLSRAVTFAVLALTLTVTGGTRSFAADGYKFTLVEVNGEMYAFRLNVATGQVSTVSGSGFVEVKDPQAIPAGAYQLYSAETLDHKLFWLYRLETQTGRAWFEMNNTWTEIAQGK